MQLTQPTAEIWIPDGVDEAAGLARTTHMAIAAHQDDVEIMALEGILAGFGSPERWLTAVIATNGAGSPRDGLYTSYTDEQMQEVRRLEQKKAAFVGEYAAAVLLSHPSSYIKDAANPGPKDDIAALLAAARPEIVYTHNLADKHDTHVAVTLRTISAIRAMPAADRPRKVYGCEVWRDLDWVTGDDKVAFNLDAHENIAAAIVGVFDSQIAGGKRYDLATMARRRAHATYSESHSVDEVGMTNFAIDLTPLVADDTIEPAGYIQGYIDRFAADVNARVKKFS